MCCNFRGAATILLAALIVQAVPARCAPDDDTDWAPVAVPAPGPVAAPATAAGGFAAPGRFTFAQKMRDHVLDQICRNLNLQHDFSVGGPDLSGSGFTVSRTLATYPDNTLAVVDDEQLVVSWSHALSRALGGDGAASKSISLSASVEGDSMVVRPLGSDTKTCDEVGRLLRLVDIKTVFPLDAKRIAAMQLGELWRVPLTLTYSEGLSASDADASLSFGRSNSGVSSLTLYRVADDQVRMRFRIDHVVVYSRSLGVTQAFPAATFAANAKNILLRLLEGQVAGQFDRYTSAWLTFGRSSTDGARIMMEFVVDPRDPVQAEAMAVAMKGDFRQLTVMAGRMSTFRDADGRALKDYAGLRDANDKTLGGTTYSATDEYKNEARSFSLSLPVFITHNASALFGNDRITDAGGEFRFYAGNQGRSSEFLDAPFIGALVKDSSQRDVSAVTHAAPGQAQGDPIVVYSRNQGYFGEPASRARETLADFNGVLKLVGARRGVVRPKTVLPIDALVPPSPVMGREPSIDGSLFLTLVFDQKAVRDMLAAPPAAVRAAVVAAVGPGERPFVDWLIAHGKLRDGALPQDANDHMSPAGELETLSRQTTGLLADLAAARGAKTNQERAQAVARMIAGGKSGLAYEDVLRVLVQFVDPMDLTSDFVASLNLKTADSHLFLKGRQDVPTLKASGDVQARFAEPSKLID
ncbi:MAG: hypothetical protein HKL90_02050 [Elusimicrobia bacterium]|nr:hypothetical protein [Elusimicrobiota bacterium]